MLQQKLLVASFCTFLGILSVSTSAFAQSSELQDIYNCRALTDSLERLACYDEAVNSFQTATKEVKQDAFGFKSSSLTSLGGLFGSNKSTNSNTEKTKSNDLVDPVKKAKDALLLKSTSSRSTLEPKKSAREIKKVTLEIRKTTEFGYKKTRFFMTNGQVWEQSDALNIRIPTVRNGVANTASIRKAALGSFFLRVNGKGSAIRVRRVR